MGNINNILFVCTGNSCRSVMAEKLLQKYLKKSGKGHILVSSAGVRALDGFPPTDETVETLKEEGLDINGFISKRLTKDMVQKADLILAMEDAHKKEVSTRVPEAASKIYMLKEFGREDKTAHPEGFDIPDPIGRPMEDYRYCLKVIKKEIERIVKIL